MADRLLPKPLTDEEEMRQLGQERAKPREGKVKEAKEDEDEACVFCNFLTAA